PDACVPIHGKQTRKLLTGRLVGREPNGGADQCTGEAKPAPPLPGDHSKWDKIEQREGQIVSSQIVAGSDDRDQYEASADKKSRVPFLCGSEEIHLTGLSAGSCLLLICAGQSHPMYFSDVDVCSCTLQPPGRK